MVAVAAVVRRAARQRAARMEAVVVVVVAAAAAMTMVDCHGDPVRTVPRHDPLDPQLPVVVEGEMVELTVVLDPRPQAGTGVIVVVVVVVVVVTAAVVG